MEDLDPLCIDTIRCLAMDAVQKAASGHPGTPMALAPAAHILFDRIMRFNPGQPLWMNRDRFVLSCGHASMLLYGSLLLNGYALRLEDIEQFRQLHSRCPGHPEYFPGQKLTPGVEVTTGPLGQGVGNSVGMAIAAAWLRSRYNQPGHEVFDYNVFAFCSDGDLMEGVASEAASLAGHLALDSLVLIYDNNHITIEGNTELAYSEDVGARFEAYHWFVQHLHDANDLAAIEAAVRRAVAETGRPSVIVLDSHIGYGSPKQDTAAAHGEPLGEDAVRAAKEFYGWDPDRHFYIPGPVEARIPTIRKRGEELEAAWEEKMAAYRRAFPSLALELDQIRTGQLPEGWDGGIPVFPADPKGLASRDSGAKVLNAIAERVPWLIGGSADLAPSTKTRLTFDNAGDFEAGSHGGRNFHFGIREHGMAASLNGITVSGLRPYGSTFFIFSDYLRPSMRLSAIMELPVIYVYTHDSIGLGEDGPTHQPIEHLASIRAMPNLTEIRPADANEVAEAWRVAMEIGRYREGEVGPVAMMLSRQALPTFDRTHLGSAGGLRRGAYILAESSGAGTPDLILMGSGSEVQWCLAARETLESEGVRTRVVSFPSWRLFRHQTPAYRDAVLPPACSARLAVEMASPFGWEQWVGPSGRVIGRDGFGDSAPLKAILQEFGFTAEHVIQVAREMLSGSSQ